MYTSAAAEYDVAESLHYGRHGVEQNERVIYARKRRRRIHDGRKILPRLQPQTHQPAEVAVFCGNRRNYRPAAEGESGHLDDEQGNEPDKFPHGLHARAAQPIDKENNDHEHEVHEKAEQRRQNVGYGHDDAREIDPAKEYRIA